MDANSTLPPISVGITRLEAWITTAQTQTYIVTATDPLGNAWAANPAPGEWDLDGVAGAFDGACPFTPASAGVGRVRCWVNGVAGNWPN